MGSNLFESDPGYQPGGTDVAVADGGTGRGTATAYMPVTGGTTSTGALQSVATGTSSYQPLMYQGASALPTFDYPIGSAAKFSYHCDHFENYASNHSSPAGPLALARELSGTSTQTSSLSNYNGALGVVGIESGTDTNSSAALWSGNAQSLYPGLGRIVFRAKCDLSALSDGTDTYTVRIGLFDIIGATGQGACFRYTHGTNSGKYEALTNDGTGPTVADTGVAALAGTWTTFEVDLNAAATSCVFKINGTTVATATVDLPTGSFGFGAQIVKSAGTTERILYCDYMELLIVPTSQ